jgi:hypothetical protein
MSWCIERPCSETLEISYNVRRDRNRDTHCDNWKSHRLVGDIFNQTFKCMQKTCIFTTKAYSYPFDGELTAFFDDQIWKA